MEMELRFQLSGLVLFTTKADCVPPVGSTFRVRTDSYKKGLTAGSLISVTVTNDAPPPEFDYSEGDEVVVYLDVNGYTVIEAGPEPD
jgi:hypothetical protein